jgi:hypothetical protein
MTQEPAPLPDRPVRIVHLRRAEIADPAVRAAWHARGYATLPPVEGHDPHRRCPVCSTDHLPPCPLCGRAVGEPCALVRWLAAGVTGADPML